MTASPVELLLLGLAALAAGIVNALAGGGSIFTFPALIAVGVPLGIVAAHKPWFYTGLRPLLDLMQTVPTFVYLIPTLTLFGLGVVPGLISTVIFAIAAPIRLTCLGIQDVPAELMDAGKAFGCSRWQLLTRIELPHAMLSIGAGVHCDGQVLVLHDLIGLSDAWTPRFAKRYAEVGREVVRAAGAYVQEVKGGLFPTEAQAFGPRRDAANG